MLTYATLDDFARINKVTNEKLVNNPTGRANLLDYLRAATRVIETRTHRAFFPSFKVKLFSIPRDYIDLRTRAMFVRDLEFNDDLLEAWRVQTGGYTTTDSEQDVPVGGITSSATSFDVTSASGLSAGTFLRIDNETLIVDAVSGNTLYVLRGQVHTRAAAHTAGTTIYTLGITSLAAGINYNLLDYNITPHYGLRVNFPSTWAGNYGIVSVASAVPQIYVTGLWGYHNNYYEMGWIDTLDTVENNPLTASGTSITVNNADGDDAQGMTRFEAGNLIRVDDELMEITTVTAGSVNTLTVLRGVRGSRATSHAQDTAIFRYHVPDDLVEITTTVAKTLKESDESVGGRQGVSDTSVGAKITLPDDAAEWIRMHVRTI